MAADPTSTATASTGAAGRHQQDDQHAPVARPSRRTPTGQPATTHRQSGLVPARRARGPPRSRSAPTRPSPTRGGGGGVGPDRSPRRWAPSRRPTRTLGDRHGRQEGSVELGRPASTRRRPGHRCRPGRRCRRPSAATPPSAALIVSAVRDSAMIAPTMSARYPMTMARTAVARAAGRRDAGRVACQRSGRSVGPSSSVGRTTATRRSTRGSGSRAGRDGLVCCGGVSTGSDALRRSPYRAGARSHRRPHASRCTDRSEVACDAVVGILAGRLSVLPRRRRWDPAPSPGRAMRHAPLRRGRCRCGPIPRTSP